MERSIAFYTRALGFEVVRAFEHEGRIFFARLRNGPVSLMLSDRIAFSLPYDDDDEHEHGQRWPGPGQISGIEVHGATWLYVPDADAAHRRLRAGGFEPLDQPRDKPHGNREFPVLDPDGYCYVIAQPLS